MIRPAPAFPAAALVLALTLSPLAAQAPADVPGAAAPSAGEAPSPTPTATPAADPFVGSPASGTEAPVASNAPVPAPAAADPFSGQAPPTSAPAVRSGRVNTTPGAEAAPPSADPAATPNYPVPKAAPLPPTPPVPPVPPVPPLPVIPAAPPVPGALPSPEPVPGGLPPAPIIEVHPGSVLSQAGGGYPGAAVQVRAGDTITSIARQHGVSVTDIKAVNGKANDVLRAGEVLRLPLQPVALPPPGFPVVESVPVAVTATAQPATLPADIITKPLPAPIPDSPLLHDTRFDVTFDGRPAGEVASLLCEKVPGINIMLPGDTGNIIIPSLSLKDVNLAELMAALTAASQADMSNGNDGYSLDPVPGAPNILIFRHIPHPPVPGGSGGGFAFGYSGAPGPGGAPAARTYGTGPDGGGRAPAGGPAVTLVPGSAPVPRAGGMPAGGGTPYGQGASPGGMVGGGGYGSASGAGMGASGAANLPVLGGGGFGGMGAVDPAGRSESAFLDLSTILKSSDLKVDDITTAIRTAWSSVEGGKTPPEGALKFHQETQLLIITATPEYLNAATSIISLLQGRLQPSQDEKDRAVEDLRRNIAQVEDNRARIQRDFEKELNRSQEIREQLQARIAELEIELAKRNRTPAPEPSRER